MRTDLVCVALALLAEACGGAARPVPASADELIRGSVCESVRSAWATGAVIEELEVTVEHVQAASLTFGTGAAVTPISASTEVSASETATLRIRIASGLPTYAMCLESMLGTLPSVPNTVEHDTAISALAARSTVTTRIVAPTTECNGIAYHHHGYAAPAPQALPPQQTLDAATDSCNTVASQAGPVFVDRDLLRWRPPGSDWCFCDHRGR